jgi:hypothetical protein
MTIPNKSFDQIQEHMDTWFNNDQEEKQWYEDIRERLETNHGSSISWQ